MIASLGNSLPLMSETQFKCRHVRHGIGDDWLCINHNHLVLTHRPCPPYSMFNAFLLHSKAALSGC